MKSPADTQREQVGDGAAQIKQALLDFLGSRSAKARFVTELISAMRRLRIGADDLSRALAELEAEGAVIMRDHFCADPHLAGVDLRIVASVHSSGDADAQLSTIQRIDMEWNKWLSEYLANHRCG
jgi:hypothetical protein